MKKLKKIGLIGGMSWESTQVYYKIINEEVRQELGGFHSARCIIESVDFAEVVSLQHNNEWDLLANIMVECAQTLENANADVLILCTNTMHVCSEAIKNNTSIPFLHIAHATGREIINQSLQKVLLLGTKFTMEKDFFRQILIEDYGIEVIVPNQDDRELVHSIIYNELVHGKITSKSRNIYKQIIERGIKNGAEGIILGCTEIPLLIKENDVTVPTFDTTRIHAESAVAFALGKELVK